MSLSNFWRKYDKKIFKAIAALSLLFIISILGNLTGLLKNELLFGLFTALDPDFPLEDLPSYYYQALILGVWFLLFALINLKYLLGTASYESIKFGKISALALAWFLLFVLISPPSYGFDFKSLTQYKNLFYQEDGIFETLTSVFLFLAAVAFFLAGRISIKKKLDVKVVSVLFFLGFFSLFFCMEEISWGQRIFDIRSPEWAQKLNSQDETNVHNICNEILQTKHCLQFLQIVFNTFFSLAIVLFASLKNRISQPSMQGLLHLEKYYFVAILIAIATVLPNELNEELISLFLLAYSYDVWKFYRDFQPHKKVEI
jgi:hypothetical protein